MGQVQVSLNGRSYRLACGEGDEARLQRLAAMVKAKVDILTLQFGQVGEERLFLMAALLMADELLDRGERAPEATSPKTAASDPAVAAVAIVAVAPDKPSGKAPSLAGSTRKPARS